MRKLKNIGTLRLSIVVLLSCFGVKVEAAQSIKYAEEISVANEFIREVLHKDTYNRIIELYDVNDAVNYLFFDLEEDGYVIVSVEHNHVVEGGESQHAYFTNAYEKYYYNGPLMYYKKSENEFMNLHTQEIVESVSKVEIDMDLQETLSVATIEMEENIMPLADTDYQVVLDGVVPIYAQVEDNTCGSTAAAMFLRYYDYYVNDNYVPTTLESRTGAALMRKLIPYIDGAFPGSTPEQLRMGLQEYINTTGVNHILQVKAYTKTLYKGLIDGGKPVLVALSEHWVTAYGYYKTMTTSVKYIVVNDGWGASDIEINPIYIEGIVYEITIASLLFALLICIGRGKR